VFVPHQKVTVGFRGVVGGPWVIVTTRFVSEAARFRYTVGSDPRM
jgi:hypothetical protein